ncbi:uncharacterized protein [Primulina eburnea]|uniref:uncharacterized protein isoform X2 n=1 Tax=Primulina eburnea TaxID=1245227 RepID=UPI003C6C80EE
MYAHTGGEDSTGIGGRPQGRPPRDIRSTEAGGVEILAADVETMTSVSIPEEESECSVLFLLDSGDESEKTLVEAVIMVE